MRCDDLKKVICGCKTKMEQTNVKPGTGMEDITQLLIVSKNILDAYNRADLEGKYGKRDRCRALLEAYTKIANETCFEDHDNSFLDLYEVARTGILNTLTDVTWIAGRRDNEKLSVWFGSHLPEVKKNNIKLMISEIYDRGLERHNKLRSVYTEEELDKYDEYFYVDEMLMYLIRIFISCIKGVKTDFDEDIPKLQSISESLRMRVGIPESELSTPKSLPTPPPNPFSNIATTMGQALNQLGLKTPDGKPIGDLVQNMDMGALGSALATTVSNPEIMQNIIGSVTGVVTPPNTSNSGGNVGESGNQASPPTSGAIPDMALTLTNMANTLSTTLANAPPAGVAVDTRTQEEKDKAAEAMKQNLNNMIGGITNMVSGFAQNLQQSPQQASNVAEKK